MLANIIAYTTSIGLFVLGIALVVELVTKNHRYDHAAIRGGTIAAFVALVVAYLVARFAAI